MKHNFERFCKDYKNIENYQKAKADNFKGWHCHHRLETHNSDGERRAIDITKKELKALGMYYHRPASELIFLTESEHNAFNKGKKRSDETRRRKCQKQRKIDILAKITHSMESITQKKQKIKYLKQLKEKTFGQKECIGTIMAKYLKWQKNAQRVLFLDVY